MKRFTYFLLALMSAASVCAQNEALWLRPVRISPDGRKIAFSYQGDLFVVPAEGGEATQLTTNPAFDSNPFWSPDGQKIAFCSDREGGKDVYVMNAEGGPAKRLTTHSSQEEVVGWLNNEEVLFQRAGAPTPQDIIFPGNTFKHIYRVSTQGGRPVLFSAISMDGLQVNGQGQVIYEDVKGYENYFRKHQTSTIARDIWTYDGKAYRQVTSSLYDERNPVFDPSGSGFYFLSEKSGSFNVYRHDGTGEETALTDFHGSPVRYLSVSNDGTLCFSFDGAVYTMRRGEKPEKLTIRVNNDVKPRDLIKAYMQSGASSVCVSPTGREVAFILNDDVYVTNIEYNTTKQITDTPERERTVDFRKDGRGLVYDSERNGVWSVYEAEIENDKEKEFAYCTGIKETLLTDGETTSFQPKYSPDGKEVAYYENRTCIKVINLKSKKSRTVMESQWTYSYQDGDQYFTWSPDSKWILAEYYGTAGWCIGDVALLNANGKEQPLNLTQSGYSEGQPRWVMGGKAMIFQSDRAGYRSHGSWGAQRDVYIMFFDQKACQEFLMNKEDFALKLASKEGIKEKKQNEKDSIKNEVRDLQLDLENLDSRTFRLTPISTSIADAVLSADGAKLYFLAPYNGATALWMKDFKEEKTEMLLARISGYELLPDPALKYCYFSGQGGSINQLELATAKVKNIPFKALTTQRPAEKMAYLYEHIWRQTREKLFDQQMNGAPWDSLYHVYKRFLPYINNGYDFAEMASELLGELCVSHTGCRYGSPNPALATSELGALVDETYQGEGVRLHEILVGGPLAIYKNLKSGAVIQAIDGVEITAGMDYFPLLAGKTGVLTRLKFNGIKEEIVIRPISQGAQNELLYKRWVKRNTDLVDSLSNGKLAYVHIRAMNAQSFHDFYRTLLSDRNRQRQAAIVDTRHNGGGWLHNDVCTFLSGVRTNQYVVRGQHIGDDPYNKWVKPSCMLVCEDNYSNAHGTPWLYKELGIGKLVGAPVPGTMTAVWWEAVGPYVFGIPQVGALDRRGQFLENQQLSPDVECYITPEQYLKGEDAQIQAAVDLLLHAEENGQTAE